jgi:hypothetical protein
VLLIAFGALILVTLLTHLGAHSPYTSGLAAAYPDGGGPGLPYDVDGLHANPDALRLRLPELTDGFYRLCGIDVASANVLMPLHSYFVSILLAFTRSYLLSHLIANVMALLLLVSAMTITCLDFGIAPRAILLAGVNILFLPWVAHYIGQPLNYTFSISLNFLITLAAIRLGQMGNRSPWLFGVLVAVILLNYDWFIFAGAIGLYLLLVHRFARWYHYLEFGVIAVAPLAIWKAVVTWANGGLPVETMRSKDFFVPVFDAWRAILKAPIQHILWPFVMSHVGIGIAVREVLGHIYWPVLVVTIVGLAVLRPPLRTSRTAWMLIFLVGLYVVEQMTTAAFDWENNPRRALPVVFAVSVAMAYVVAKTHASRAWRGVFVGLAVCSAVLSFSDRLLQSPAVHELQTGEAVHNEPKWPMSMLDKRLTKASMPVLPVDKGLTVGKFKPTCVAERGPKLKMPAAAYQFVIAQVLLGGGLAAVIYVCSRLRWLPRFATLGYSVVFALSFVARFLW